MAQKGGMKAAMVNKGGVGTIKFAGGGNKGVALDSGGGAKGPSPKAAQLPTSLKSERKSDDKAAKRGGRNGADK